MLNKKNRSVYVFLFFYFFISCSIIDVRAQTLSLNGNDWKLKDVPSDDNTIAFCKNWISARVPGNIQADLETNRILTPLWYGSGDTNLFNVAKKDWVYRKEFKVPSDFLNKTVRLIFEGVDNSCEVWLNGKRLGNNPNMFRRFQFNVAGVLKVGATNLLEVRISRIPPGPELYIRNSDGKESGVRTKWFFVEGLRNTLETLKDLKSPTNFGWDWGVNIWTLGIWKDVHLEASGSAAIELLKIETSLSANHEKAKVKVKVFVNSETKEERILKINITGNGAHESVDIPFTAAAKGSTVLYREIDINSPSLWWPNGHGDQKLYNLDAELLDSSHKSLHKYHSRFGIREVEWQHTAEAPADFPIKYMLVMNGRPIRMIGSNIIPPDLLFGRIPERTAHLLKLAKESGFTVLRLWGGGVIFSPQFYDLADELGIMLQVEMPIASLDPVPDPEFLKNSDTTLRNIIRQIWNHPSIIKYSGGNEMQWGTKKKDFTVLNHFRKILAEEDSSRAFLDTDPIVGGAHSPWYMPLTISNVIDPLNNYTVWDSMLPPRVKDGNGKYPKVTKRFMSYGEFGYQTPANLETWQRDIPPSAQWPIDKENPIMIRKNVTYAVFESEVWLEKPLIDFLFGQLSNLEYLLKAGQFIGAEGLRYAMDAVRRRGPATGVMMTWDFNEPWTNGAGSYQVDYDGRPLMNYAFAKQAAAQLSLSLRHQSSLYNIHEGIKTTLYLTSDAAISKNNLRWSWKARDRRGAIISSEKGLINIDPIDVKKLTEIHIALPNETAFGPIFVELQLTDAAGKILNERVHIFGLLGVSSSFRGLLKHNLPDEDDDMKILERLIENKSDSATLPELFKPVSQTTLKVETKTRANEHEEIIEFILTNTGKMTALFCEPKPILNYRTDVIIHNLFTCIPPGESRTLKISAPRKSKVGMSIMQTGWRIETWNAPILVVAPSSDVLLAFGRTDRMCREFAGYENLNPQFKKTQTLLKGRLSDPGKVPYLFDKNQAVECVFPGTSVTSKSKALLRIHSSDQSTTGMTVIIEVNGNLFKMQMPAGYGLQDTNPSHLAQAKSVEIKIPAGVLKPGNNILRIKPMGKGWFTWDALDLRIM